MSLGFTEKSDFYGLGGWIHEKPIYRGKLPNFLKRWALDSLLIYRGLGEKEGNGVFEGGGD